MTQITRGNWLDEIDGVIRRAYDAVATLDANTDEADILLVDIDRMLAMREIVRTTEPGNRPPVESQWSKASARDPLRLDDEVLEEIAAIFNVYRLAANTVGEFGINTEIPGK